MTQGAEIRTRNSRVQWLLAAAVLLFGLAVTAWFLRNDRQREQEYFDASFNAVAERVYINITHRLQAYQAAMRGVQGFLSASSEVNHKQFQRYVASLNMATDLPGVQAIGFARLVSSAELAAHVQRQRADLHRSTP